MAETKEYLDYNGLSEYHKKAKDLFQDLTIQDVEEVFNELDESDPSYSAFYDVIQKAKEATANADSKAAAAVTATNNANTATSNADKATERANKAAEKLETVNDMTTGVNLLRGTRDFRLGTQLYNGGLYYSDGFKNSAYTFSKDEEGFTVATISSNGSSTNYLNGSVIPISGDDQVFTISIEFKVDSRIDNASPIFFTMGLYKGDNSRVSSKEFNVSEVLGIPYSNLEIGKWYQLVVHYNITDSISDGYYLLPSISINGTGIKSVRKLMVQHGSVNNPIWTASPFDYVNSYDWENGVPFLLQNIPVENFIKAGDDLNNFTKPGIYAVDGDAIANGGTIANMPPGYKNGSFKLVVSYRRPREATVSQKATESRLQQDFYCSSDHLTFSRIWSTSKSPASFGDWVKVRESNGRIPVESGGTGWEHGLNSGINLVPDTSDEWSDWITPTPNTSNAAINPIGCPSGHLIRQLGDVYTNYVEIEFENVTATPGQTFVFRANNASKLNDVSGWQYNLANPWGSSALLTSPPENKVYKFVFHSTMTSTDYIAENLDSWILGFRCDYWASGRYRYRCVKMERGRVDYPQWTQAPDDIEAINDITTGINLLKGTRDCIEGSIRSTFANICNDDGFRRLSTSSYITIKRDDDGFGVININNSDKSQTVNSQIATSVVYGIRAGDVITFSFEFMIDDVNNYYSTDDIGGMRCVSNGNTTVNGVRFDKSSVPSLNSVESGKWYRATVYITCGGTAGTEYAFYAWFNMSRYGSINFRKSCACKGHIENVEWSASPFDVAQVTQIDNVENNGSGFKQYKIYQGMKSVNLTGEAGKKIDVQIMNQSEQTERFGRILTPNTDMFFVSNGSYAGNSSIMISGYIKGYGDPIELGASIYPFIQQSNYGAVLSWIAYVKQ